MTATNLSRRAFFKRSTSDSWSLLWEAGPYYERVAKLLERAQSYAIFVGWQIDSRIHLSTERDESFRSLVLRLCQQKPDLHIYFLMWDYAYFYVFEREALQGWVWDGVHERVHFVFDNRHPYGGSHHEKIVVVDGKTAFVGGVDICGDRWDSPEHLYKDGRRSLVHDLESHQPYHDLIVEVSGEVAGDITEHIGERWRGLSSEPFPNGHPSLAPTGNQGGGRYPLVISRTRASLGIQRPQLVRETEFLFRELIRQAKFQLVIENQYYWSQAINDELIRVMRARRDTGFRLLLVVPSVFGGSVAFRMMGVVQTRLLDELQGVAGQTGTRLVFGCPFTRAQGQVAEKRVYVHSKVLIVDDRYLAIGSSNFNNRGFRLDSELTLTLLGESEAVRATIRGQAQRVVAHWGSAAVAEFEGRADSDTRPCSHIYLKSYHRAWDDYFQTGEGILARMLPLQKIFDPRVPFGFLLKSRLAIGNLARVQRVLPLVICDLLLLALGSSFVLMTGLVRFSPRAMIPALTYSLFLSMSWALPLPTMLCSFFAGAQLGARPATVLVFCSLLVSATLGYLVARVYPGLARRLMRTSLPGLRRLPVVMQLVCNPRLSFQAKILSQGFYSIPLRWFGPGVWLLALMNCVCAVLGSQLALGVEDISLLVLLAVTLLLATVRRCL